LYQETFADAPYFEKFSEEEVREFFEEYRQQGILYIASSDTKVIGFGAMLPLPRALPRDILDKLQTVGINVNETWYNADLGVDKDFRRKGIGTQLVKARLDAVRGQTVVMRTSGDNKQSQSIYQSLGFEQIPGITQVVEGRRQDGRIKKDVRIFFIKKSV